MIVGRQDGGHTTSLRTTPTSPRHSKHMAGTVVETGAAATVAAPPLMASSVTQTVVWHTAPQGCNNKPHR